MLSTAQAPAPPEAFFKDSRPGQGPRPRLGSPGTKRSTVSRARGPGWSAQRRACPAPNPVTSRSHTDQSRSRCRTFTPPLRGATSGPGTQVKPGSAASPEHCHRSSGEPASCGGHAHSTPRSVAGFQGLIKRAKPTPPRPAQASRRKGSASREGRGRPVAQAVRKGGRGPGRHKPRLLPLQGCGAATLSSTFPLLLPRGTRLHIHRGMC